MRTGDPDRRDDLFAQVAAWRALDFSEAGESMKTASQESDNRVPTLVKSSYRLPAAATQTVDEQQGSHSGSDIVPRRQPCAGLDAEASGLQA